MHHHGYKDKGPELDTKLAGLQVTSQRIKATSGSRQLRGTMMASVLYGKCLYGSGCHYINRKRTRRMRRIMCKAIGDEHGTQTRRAHATC